MESKNLNDIVIEDNEDSKKAQLKNILTLLALLFIILVISIVITKLMLGSDEENNVTTALSGETVKEQQNSDTISNTAAVATGVAAATAAATVATHSATATSSTVKSDEKKEDASAPAHSTQRDIASRKKLPLRDHRPKKEVKHHIATPKKEVKHRVVHHTNEYRPPVKKKNVTHHSTPAKKHTTEATTKGYYIKVGAFKDPSNAIKKIKASHLKYKTTKVGSVTRVLVGPYYSQKDAQKDIAKVRAHIAHDAFITKLP